MNHLLNIAKNNVYMLRLVAKSSKLYILDFFLRIFFVYLGEMLLVAAPKVIFDTMQNGQALRDILGVIIIYIALTFLIHSCIHITTYFKSVLEAKLKLDLNVTLGDKFMHLDYVLLEQNQSIDMFNKAKMAISGGLNDVQTMGMAGEQGLTGFFDQMGNMIKDVLVIISVLYVFSYTEWYIMLLIVACVGVNLFANIRKTYTTVSIRKEAGPYLTKSRYCNKLLRGYEYGKEFRIFDMSDFIISKFDACTDEYLSVRDRFRNKRCFAVMVSGIASAVLKAGILISLLYSFIGGKITVGDFSMVFAAVISFSENTINFANSLISMNIFSEYMLDYQKCMSLEEKDMRSGTKELEGKDHMIEFRDVWFQYPGSTAYALKGLDVKIDSKWKWSIVGFNGAGKSTFIKLLLGLYEPQQGSILIDGIDRKEYTLESLRNYMSAVFQDYKIFAMQIDENIALGQEIAEDKLQEAMRKSGIAEKVDSLQKKSKSVIGGFFDNGDMLLSGGESQKIAMSRSFYRETDVFILDEPTSALDVLSEDKMYRSVAENLTDEMVVFISHRLASTRFCDRILVFEDGKVAEQGSHEELLARKGIYAEMWKVQAEKFRKEAGGNA